MKEVILIDAGTGNLRSVQKALECAGASVQRTDQAGQVLSAKRVVLPGVGAFGGFMSGLRARGLDSAVREIAARGTPLLGICVGMQALFEVGEEMGRHDGLGLFPGQVMRLQGSSAVKIPHTGWNQLKLERGSPLFKGLDPCAYVYFNHSYFCRPAQPADILATTEYGIPYTSAVGHENMFGVQFHPEKSQAVGLRILRNFLEAA